MNSMDEEDSTSVKFIIILTRFHNNAMNKLNFRLNYSIKPFKGGGWTTLCNRSIPTLYCCTSSMSLICTFTS